MKRTLQVLVIALTLIVAATVVAQPAPEPQPSAPTVTLSVEQFAALVAKTAAGAAPVAAVVAPAPAAVSADGILGFSWATIFGGLGSLLVLLFGLFKGAGWIKARQMVLAAAEGAWHIAERAGAIYELDGATKGALALEAFIKALGGSATAPQIASARALWEAQSAKAGLAEVAPAQLAAAQAAAQVAAPGATATDLADKAAR